MSSYSFFREIYDVNGLYIYIIETLPSILSVNYNNGNIITNWPSALSNEDQVTLAGLITSYSNPQIAINVNNFRNISVGNSTTATLSSNSTFTGFYEDVSDYSSITINIFSNVASASNGLILQFSSDGTNLDNSIYYTSDLGGECFVHPCIAKFFRVVYTNGVSSQGTFRLQTIYHYYKSASFPTVNVTSSLTDNAVCQLSRTFLTGKMTNGTYKNVKVNVDGELFVNQTTTAFGATLSESLYPLVQNEFTFIVNSDITTTTLTGSGTVSQVVNYAAISSGAATSSSAILRSRKSVKCRVGQGIRCMFTAFFPGNATGNTQIIGVGNDQDGLFFGYNGTSFGIMIRNNTVDNWISQTSWNFDIMNGAGPSGMTLNPQNNNVMLIYFQWLGAGLITFAIEETSTGAFHPVHRIQYANTANSTILYQPHMNMMASSANTTNNTNITMNVICLSAFLEGGIPSFNGPKFSVEFNKTISVATYVPILSIRNNITYNSKTNRISLYIRNITCSSDSKSVIYTLYHNATLTNSNFANSISANSMVNYDTAATAISGGTSIYTIVCGIGSSINQNFDLYQISIEPGEILTIAARVPAELANICICGLSWVEDV